MSGKIASQHEWVGKIEGMLPSAIGLNLRRKADVKYVETVDGKPIFSDADAYKFGNSTLHDGILYRAVPALEAKAGKDFVAHLLGELTFRKTYGAFSEMAAYDWMGRTGIDYTPPVERTAAEVVNRNGSTIDGKFAGATQDIFFDIKGFGFVEHKIELLKQRLEDDAPGDEVIVEGIIAASIDDIQSLLERPGYDALKNELAQAGTARRGTLVFTRRPRPRVSMSVSEPDPVTLAVQNREYALRYGSQFQRIAPFMLFFVMHPWFSQGSLHQNFAGFTGTFCQEFARQTFDTFNSAQTLPEGMPTADLVKLLSAIAFINVWPEAASKGRGPQSRIYLNPHATHKLDAAEFAGPKARLGADLLIVQL
jgi:hypothetical protein